MSLVARKARSAFIRLRRFLVSARFGASPSLVYRDSYYNDGGFAKTDATAQVITAYLSDTYHPDSVLDIGCGTGVYLRYFAARGCQVVGVEGSAAGISRVPQEVAAIQHDLRKPLQLEQQFDLVMCIEVAEHIPEKFSETLIHSICRHAKDVIVFTAAPPGTPGEDHINCRPRSFWDALFERHGFVFDLKRTEDLMQHARQRDTAEWFQQWACIYVARNSGRQLRSTDMCGIAGAIGRPETSDVIVRSMLRAMAHRGPDGDGVWSDVIDAGRSVVVGHRRLAILDLSEAGAQPMEDASGRLVLTHNGEIYNFLEVRAELLGLGVTFRSQSDTEVILEVYKQWGPACLSRLNGMFAFVLYDRDQGVLFCARDRYGEKPLLFGFGKGSFAFASEYKGLLQHPELSLDIDEWRLLRAAHNANTGLDGDRQTLFNDVQQLLPGEAMEVNVRTLEHRIWSYWRITPAGVREDADEREVFAEFRDLLIDSVRLRLRSDVPVGSCLSGGLDSSAIVCIVRELLGPDAPYNTFTGRFPGTSADEWSYAEQVIDATNSISHTVEPTVERFLTDLPRFMWHNELPVGSSSQFAQWCVFDLAKQRGVTVLLDGQGADEMLGGYEQYFGAYTDALRERGESDRLARELPLIRERYPLALALPARGLRDRVPFGLRHWLSNRFAIGDALPYGMRPDIARRVAVENSLMPREGFNPLNNALCQDTFGRSLTSLLRYGDRNSMAHSREVRLPFCDHRIAEFVLALPPHLLMGDVQTKRVLRESMRGILPEPIRTRWNKQGFRPPQELWFESPQFLRLVEDTVHAACRRADSPWLPAWWASALERARAGQTTPRWGLWAPFIIEQWRQHFLQPLADARGHRAGDAA